MDRKTRLISFALFIFCAATIASLATAADYPTRPITLQVPVSAGGPTDTGARILAAIAEKRAGQPFIVVNKPGAGLQIGYTELSRAKPDGYYLGFVMLPSVNTVILDPERKADFTLDSFIPIINQVSDAGVMIVKPESPYKTLKDLIADAKKRPGEISATTTGILGDDHLAILMLERAAGIKFRIVHFDSAAQGQTALFGGHVDVCFDNIGGVHTREKAGQARVLAVMASERSHFMPHVPCTAELGLPSVISSSSRGIMAPKGTPSEVIKKIQQILFDSIKSPEHIEKMEKAGFEVKPLVGEEYAKNVKEVHAVCMSLMDAARKSR